MKSQFLLSLIVAVLMATSQQMVLAQDGESCPTLVQMAYDTTEAACQATGQDQACYGNLMVEASPQPQAEPFEFDSPGDLAGLASINTLKLSSMDEATQQWGISLLKVHANLPTDATQNVDVLLFGNVEIQNQVSGTPPEPVLIEVTAQNDINIRAAPSTNNLILGVLRYNQTATADGRNEAGDWLRIIIPESNDTGWVYAPLVTVDGDVDELLVTDPNAVTYGPMQAFYFRSGVSDRPCDEAPDSGILIQTPEGAGEITFLINEVTIELGSTIYLQAQPSAEMTISVVEGQARVAALGTTVTVPAGARVRVPLDENAIASGAPSRPEPYDDVALTSLPVQLMSQQITIAPAMTQQQLESQSLESQIAALRVECERLRQAEANATTNEEYGMAIEATNNCYQQLEALLATAGDGQ